MTSGTLAAPRRAVGGAVADTPVNNLLPLEVRRLWDEWRRQPLSFWLVCGYMLFEYVRPQAIYTWLAPVPWAQILILGAPIAYLLEGGQFKLGGLLNTGVVIFVTIVLLSWMFAYDPSVSQAKISVIANWFIAFVLIANLATTESRFFLFYLLFLLASLKMSQHGVRTWAARGFGSASWGATGAPGWFQNSGEFGIQMCIYFPLSVYFYAAAKKYVGKWKRAFLMAVPASAIMSIIATNSRGAIIGIGLVAIWMIARTRYRVRAFVGLALLAGLVYTIMPADQRERFTTMGDDKTSESRLTYWRNGITIYKEHPVIGIGYENWARYYEDHYGRTVLPHNIFIQAGSELGTLGFGALLLLMVLSFIVNKKTRTLARKLGEGGKFYDLTARGLDGAMIGFIGSAFFVTVLYYPFLWFGLGMTAALHATVAAAAARGRTVAAQGPLILAPVHGWRTWSSSSTAGKRVATQGSSRPQILARNP